MQNADDHVSVNVFATTGSILQNLLRFGQVNESLSYLLVIYSIFRFIIEFPNCADEFF